MNSTYEVDPEFFRIVLGAAASTAVAGDTPEATLTARGGAVPPDLRARGPPMAWTSWSSAVVGARSSDGRAPTTRITAVSNSAPPARQSGASGGSRTWNVAGIRRHQAVSSRRPYDRINVGGNVRHVRNHAAPDRIAQWLARRLFVHISPRHVCLRLRGSLATATGWRALSAAA